MRRVGQPENSESQRIRESELQNFGELDYLVEC